MGNSCYCNTGLNYIKDLNVNICKEEGSKNEITENNINGEEKENVKDKKVQRIIQIKKYFELNDQEIINFLNDKEKEIKNNIIKKRESIYNPDDNNYELILKRLLEQKKIKRKGPKRRETIRKNENIQLLVNEVINENGNEIQNNNQLNKSITNTSDTLIIKNKNDKMRFSITVNKESKNFINNKLNRKHLKNINTMNEFINEVNASSDLGKKETNKK